MESIKKGSSLIWRGKGRGRERPMATGARRRADSGLTAETGYKMISFRTDQRKEGSDDPFLAASFPRGHGVSMVLLWLFTRARRRALWERPSV